jgi:hypothetical protein
LAVAIAVFDAIPVVTSPRGTMVRFCYTSRSEEFAWDGTFLPVEVRFSNLHATTCTQTYGKWKTSQNERGERARASKKGLLGSKSYALDGVGVL